MQRRRFTVEGPSAPILVVVERDRGRGYRYRATAGERLLWEGWLPTATNMASAVREARREVESQAVESGAGRLPDGRLVRAVPFPLHTTQDNEHYDTEQNQRDAERRYLESLDWLRQVDDTEPDWW